MSWLLVHKPLFGAILETHIKEPFLNPIMSNLCPSWNYTSNHSEDEDGRIILIWKHPVNLQVVCKSRQSLTCRLTLPNKPVFYYTAVYASNEVAERSDLWAELIQIQTALNLDDTAWLIGGDFNQILHPEEHSSPDVSAADTQMFQFRDCLLQAGVFDLRYNGSNLTWTNNQPSNPTTKKLDRLLVNNSTISAFPHAYTTFLPQSFSDHCPCLTDLAFSLPKAGTQPFKFQNYLTKHPGFSTVVNEAWIRAGSTCFTLTQFCWKLKVIKRDLKLLNRENYSKIQERVSETHSLLQCVQVRALQTPTPELFEEERELHQKWLFLREIEEAYFRQKSRINWLREGDFNTTYFHRICQVRASYNAIRSFLDASGMVITDPMGMSLLAELHFKSILGPQLYLPPPIPSPVTWFAQLISFRCDNQQIQKMLSVPSSEEIRKLFFKLNPNKAPGPDGLTSGFFKGAWETVGEEAVISIQHFFATSFLPLATNSTILSLVPKFPGAVKISDFRPIACLNTVYKVISRLLVSRLKPILKDLILPCQTAFVKDRLLVENTVLASELIHGYHKNKGPKRITIKVDIAKAFDTLSWEFLLSCLEGLSLPPKFISLLRACICTTNFMIGYNGTVSGYFKGKRGLRQGTPFLLIFL